MPGQDHVGDGDRAGIDEGIARNAALVFELDDGVERAARRLAADALPQPVADLAERERQREHLRDALDRERRVAVAARRDVAVGVDHGEAEGLWIDPGELGNIGRDLAAIRPLRHLVGDFFDDLVKVGHAAAHSNSSSTWPCGSSPELWSSARLNSTTNRHSGRIDKGSAAKPIRREGGGGGRPQRRPERAAPLTSAGSQAYVAIVCNSYANEGRGSCRCRCKHFRPESRPKTWNGWSVSTSRGRSVRATSCARSSASCAGSTRGPSITSAASAGCAIWWRPSSARSAAFEHQQPDALGSAYAGRRSGCRRSWRPCCRSAGSATTPRSAPTEVEEIVVQRCFQLLTSILRLAVTRDAACYNPKVHRHARAAGSRDRRDHRSDPQDEGGET